VTDRAARASLFGQIDLWVNATTVLTQLFLTARIMGRLGVGWTLALLPLLSVAGFSILASSPVLAVLVVFQVARRAANYALMRPARETLFTILSLSEKYKAKSFIDTFVYRGGDALGSGLFDLLTRIGMSLGAIAWVAVPVSFLWAAVGAWLGRRQGKEAAARGYGDEPEVASARAAS
jgi:AAA family ATP:ADP antiporter